MSDDIRHWREGAAIIETCLAKAVRSDHADAPFPLDATQAALWHQAQAEAYRHALEMMTPPEEVPAATGGAADGGDLGPYAGPGIAKSHFTPATADPYDAVVPTRDQDTALARIANGYRTIVAGAPNTGRTVLAILAARRWNASDRAGTEGPALLVVEASQKRALSTGGFSDIAGVPHMLTHDELLASNDVNALLSGFGMVVLDDADGPVNGVTAATDAVLRSHADNRVVRMVLSGANDDDATVVLKQVLRQAV